MFAACSSSALVEVWIFIPMYAFIEKFRRFPTRPKEFAQEKPVSLSHMFCDSLGSQNLSRMLLFARHYLPAELLFVAVLRMLGLTILTAAVSSFGLGTLTHILYASVLWPFYFSPLRQIPTVPGFPL